MHNNTNMNTSVRKCVQLCICRVKCSPLIKACDICLLVRQATNSGSRVFVSFTHSLSDFLRLAVCSLVSRALAALTSLFLDAVLVVSGLLPRNTWPHGQASFLAWIWLPQLGHAQNKGILVQIPTPLVVDHANNATQGLQCGLVIENRPSLVPRLSPHPAKNKTEGESLISRHNAFALAIK